MSNRLTDCKAAIARLKRRGMLYKHHPSCPKCGESFQVQLVEWLWIPAKWKCRTCKTRWEEEPNE